MTAVTFRKAEREDTGKILAFIYELAEYEHMTGDVIADEDTLNEWLFERKAAEVLFILNDGKEVGYMLFFHNFSTFLGRAGIYLEDLYVRPEFRGQGFGKAALKELARIAAAQGCGRVEWSCLDWNEPSIKFYLSLGAVPLSEWTVYRLTGQALKDMAAKG